MNDEQELADIERKIERVARAICKRLGYDPDDRVFAAPAAYRRPKDHFIMRGSLQAVSLWTLYYNEAQAAVEALSEVKA
jgi:hypothetical protein